MVSDGKIPDGDVVQRWNIRKAFEDPLAKEVKTYAKAQWDEMIERVTNGSPSLQEVEKVFARFNFDLLGKHGAGRCSYRAFYLMLKYPHIFNESTLRAGSLGAVRNDGSIHWEFG